MLRPRTSPAAIHRAAFSSIAARRVHITSTAPTFDSVANQDPTRAYPSAASSAPSPGKLLFLYVKLSIFELTNKQKKIDARFQVLGSPFSLLSVSLSASQNLYTRRGTLVGLTGKVENVNYFGISRDCFHSRCLRQYLPSRFWSLSGDP